MLSVIRDPEELETLREEWSELWRNDPRATPFQSPEWLLPWWRHLFRGGQLWTIAERRDGRLQTLLPLFRYGEHREHVAFVGTGVSDYLDVLGDAPESIPGDWRHAALEEIRDGSPLLKLGRSEPCSVCPVLELPPAMNQLRKQMEPKLVVDIHRSTNRLQAAGRVSIERTTDITDLFTLHRARWQERNEEGVLDEPALETFHHEVAAGFECLGILRYYRLTFDERAVAVIYAFTHRQRTYAYLSGFDPETSRLSPGTVLLAHVIEDAMREDVREFDFLRNPETYKYRWGAQDRPNFRVIL